MSLESYINAFESLTPQSIHTHLLPCFAKDAYFQDPFNQVKGHDDIRKIFEHMYDTLNEPCFRVVHSAQVQEVAYIEWVFTAISPRSSQPIEFEGVSKVILNDDGLVQSHIDYWDPTEPVYRKVPVLKWLVQGVRNVLKVKC